VLRVAGIATVTVLLVLALGDALARADIGVISVTPARAYPGQLVTVIAGAYKKFPRMPLYLVARTRVRPPHPCGPGRVLRHGLAGPAAGAPYLLAGLLDFRRHPHRVRVRFRLPRLAAGVYELLIYCDLCHRGPGGTLISNPSALLRVER